MLKLYKKNYKNKIFYLSIILTIFSIYWNFEYYIGTKALFVIFNISALLLFLTVIRKNVSAFEFFFAFFLLLSFWFKFSCILYFDDVKVREGNFDLNISNYDKSTIVIIISFIGFIIGSFLRELIVSLLFKDYKFEIKVFFLLFYKKYKSYILFIFIFFLLIIYLTNFYYKIYNRGLINENIPTLIKYFFSWSFTYGLSAITAILIYLDYCISKSKKYFYLGILETFASNITIYSRGFLLSIFSYIRGFLYLNYYKKQNFSILSVSKIFLLLSFMFLSFYVVSQLRNINFIKEEFHKPKKIESIFSEFRFLSINRWVGIDALLSVSQSKHLSFKFLKSSLSEKKKFSQGSFYIDNFYQNFKNTDIEKINVVITPGIIPYLFYSGSVMFVFFSIIAIIIFCSLIEKLFFIFSAKNQILINIIGYAMAIRLIHFGYLPYNTIYYFLSIFITLLCVYTLSILIWKKF
ncbi:hypothetical protein OAQ25_05675 [Candidatus Pelagibacter sp.]|nr:hypothetical protein [Candidatus Pelagibacter sp.]